MLNLVNCRILNVISNEFIDAYLLRYICSFVRFFVFVMAVYNKKYNNIGIIGFLVKVRCLFQRIESL